MQFRHTLITGLLYVLLSGSAWAQHSNKLLLDSIFYYICNKSIKYPDIVIRQVILETGWLRAPFLMSRNNLFGFRGRRGYMRFGSWHESVDYYKNWQERHYTDSTENYKRFLRRMRFGSRRYMQYLNKIRYEKRCPQETPPE